GRIVIVDAGQDLRRHPEQHVPDAKARGDRPGGQIGVDIGRGKAGQWRRKRYRAEKSGLALLVSDAAIDDQVDAFNDRFGEPGGGALALLVAVVERRVGALAVGDELVEPDRGVDRASARQAELLIVAGYREKGLQVGRGVVDAADAVALVER